MPLPRGSDPDKVTYGYLQALAEFPIAAIVAGIRKFLRGECEDVSRKFCPHPPELADIVRGTMPSKSTTFTGKYYRYRAPDSKIVERRVTKEFAWALCRNGVHPKGCIWLPGDPENRPDVGDLYGPDPEWQRPTPLEQAKDAPPEPYNTRQFAEVE